MGILALGVVVEVFILFFLTRWVVNKLYVFLLLLFHARSVAVSFVTAILFPGTIIHELAHLFTAELLGVRTGTLTLVPESIREESEIQTGSVAIAKTDPIRRALIGLAPLTIGLVAVAGLSYMIMEVINGKSILFIPQEFTTNYELITLIVLFYLLFTISSSMFPSKPDFKGIPAVGITLGLFLLAAYFLGIRVGLTGQLLTIGVKILSSLVQSLGIVLAVNILILLMLTILIVLIGKITKYRVSI